VEKMIKFKTDENLPVVVASVLKEAGFDADTVYNQRLSGFQDDKILEACIQEQRTLLTLDLDFADIRVYPPAKHFGIIVLRIADQSKDSIVRVIKRLLPFLGSETILGCLWIVEEDRIRVQGEKEDV